MNIEKRIMEILSDGYADGYTICCIMYAEAVSKTPKKGNNIKRADKFTNDVMQKLTDLTENGVLEWHCGEYRIR